MNTLIQRSFLNALATVEYISIVAVVMRNAEKIFEPMDNLWGPITFLMLFILSAAITGSLVLGKPVLMYLNGNKSEAVKLFLYTIGWLGLGIIVLLLVNLK